jgi:hypothetical protein
MWGPFKIMDRLFAISGRWALASDNLQWILQKRFEGKNPWRPVSFVRSTRNILARCMREKGCPAEDAERLLVGLPSTFNEWNAERRHRGIDTSDSSARP